MEVFVRLPGELRDVVLVKAVSNLEDSVESIKEESEELERELTRLFLSDYMWVSYAEVVRDIKEFISAERRNCNMKISRKNRRWRDIVRAWIDDPRLVRSALNYLGSRYWSKEIISNRMGLMMKGLVDDNDVNFYVNKDFCFFSSSIVQQRERVVFRSTYSMLLELKMIAKREIEPRWSLDLEDNEGREPIKDDVGYVIGFRCLNFLEMQTPKFSSPIILQI